jgi:hypothetical protein
MPEVYEQNLWIPQNFPVTNPDLHHRLLVACRSDFVTAEAAGGVGVLPLDGPSVGGVGVDIAAELAS